MSDLTTPYTQTFRAVLLDDDLLASEVRCTDLRTTAAVPNPEGHTQAIVMTWLITEPIFNTVVPLMRAALMSKTLHTWDFLLDTHGTLIRLIGYLQTFAPGSSEAGPVLTLEITKGSLGRYRAVIPS